jgi:hypothetical protein
MERPTIRGASSQPLRALLFTGACAGMLLVFVPLPSATRALGGQPVATDVGYYTCEHWRYEVRPVAWEGGSAWTTLSYAPTATYCAPQLAGASYEKVTGTAYTFGSGVYLSGHIGINLSARTGFSTLTGYRFAFISAGQLCGTNANVPEDARIVGKGS